MHEILKMTNLAWLLGFGLAIQAEPAKETAANPAAIQKPPAATRILGKAVTVSGEINYSGNNIRVDADKGIITLDGNAKVWDAKVTITADRMVLTLNADLKPAKIEATGNVVCVGKTVVAGQEIDAKALGGYGIYQVVDQIITLTEKPRLVRGQSYLEGMEKLIYDKKINAFRTEGGSPVGGIFPADIPKSKDESQPAAGGNKIAEPAK